jgi:hypothetical protein
MSTRISEIPYWGILLDCFPELVSVVESSNLDPKIITNEQWWAIARWWRNALLNESDWSQVPDNSLTEEQREQWRQYRSELRNITDVYPDPRYVVFPGIPS